MEWSISSSNFLQHRLLICFNSADSHRARIWRRCNMTTTLHRHWVKTYDRGSKAVMNKERVNHSQQIRVVYLLGLQWPIFRHRDILGIRAFHIITSLDKSHQKWKNSYRQLRAEACCQRHWLNEEKNRKSEKSIDCQKCDYFRLVYYGLKKEKGQIEKSRWCFHGVTGRPCSDREHCR